MRALLRRVLFPRHRSHGPRPVIERDDLERHWLATDQGPVEYWFVRAPAAFAGPRPVALYAHGNADRIDELPAALAPYLARGVHLLLPEYRGYGHSAGTPSQARITGDCERILRRTLARPDVDPSRVLFHGRSLGGGVVCALSLCVAPAAMVLESTFVSMAAIFRAAGAPGWLSPDPFDNAAALAKFAGPCAFFHGDEDRRIPTAHAHALLSYARAGRLRVFAGAGHATPIYHESAYWNEIDALLRRAW